MQPTEVSNVQTGKQTKKIKDMTKNIQFLFCLIVKQRSGKQYVIIKFFLSVLDGVFPLVGTVVPGLIINELTDGRISYVLVLYVIILLMFPVLQGLIQTGLKNYLFRLTEQIKMFNLKEFYEHVTKMDYEMLEQPDIQDRKNHASKILNDSLSVVEEIGSFMRALVSMILISSIITTLNPIITIVIIGSVLIDAKITKNLKQKNYETQKKIWDKARRQWGFGYMLETFDFAKDLRIFSVGELLIQKFLNNERSINIDKKRMNTDSYKASIQSVLLAFLNQVILYIYLIYMVVVKDLAVGSMTIFLSATGQFSNSLSSVMQS